MKSGNQDIRLTLGSLLVGAFLNTYLFGIVIYQFFRYFKSSKSPLFIVLASVDQPILAGFEDPLWTRCMVHALLVNDIINSAVILYIPWYYLVDVHEAEALAQPVWSYLLNPLFETLAASLTQIFLTHRLYRLNRCKYLYILLLILIGLEFLGGFLAGLGPFFMSLTTMAQVHRLRYIYSVWLFLQVTVDTILSTFLAWEFYAFRDTGNSRSNRVVVYLIRKAIQTGAFATVFAITSAITQLYWEDTGNLAATFALPLGRIYTNAIMDTLLMRKDLRGVFADEGHKLTEIVARDLRRLDYDYEAVPQVLNQGEDSDSEMGDGEGDG